MLSWSAQETGRTVDISSIVDPSADPELPGGRELVLLGLSVRDREVPSEIFGAVAGAIGEAAAFEAAAVAANFQIMNRIVDATGLPFPAPRIAEMADVVEALGLKSFPHAEL